MMGGDIGVNSTFGVGSTFWFDIVLEPDPAQGQVMSVPHHSILKGMRVLVVDDNELARTIIREQLQSMDVKVVEAGNGKQALKLLEDDQAFDAMLVDYIMPVINGIELAAKVKENAKTRDIPLIMITSVPARGDVSALSDIGVVGYLSKPISGSHLCDALAVIADAVRSGRAIPVITKHNLSESRIYQSKKHTEKLQFSNVTVLLAEDNPVNQAVAISMLAKYGVQVTVASNGDDAIRILKATNFDMVFMDCQMPVMDGFEATAVIRKLETYQKRAHIPVVALTANAMKGDDEKCFAAGMDDYLSKPLRQHELERVLMKWLPAEKRNGLTESAPAEPPQAVNSDVIDANAFGVFASLMGDNLAQVLQRHQESVAKYMTKIKEALDNKDYKAAAHAAHPLKSSSQQIGVYKVADIAREIETHCATDNPDSQYLQRLLLDVSSAQHSAFEALDLYCKGRAA